MEKSFAKSEELEEGSEDRNSHGPGEEGAFQESTGSRDTRNVQSCQAKGLQFFFSKWDSEVH